MTDPSGTDGEGGDEAHSTRDALAERRGVETTVYQPAEDSTLLADAGLAALTADDRILEVGTGSGWVATRVATEVGADVVASDLNPAACREARDRAAAADADVDVVRGDLVSPFADGAFDAVLFNPPYLPTSPDAEWDDWMETALSGGESGRAVIEPFLDSVGRVLAPGGQVLLLVSSLTGYDDVLAYAADKGFTHDVVREESYPYEALSVLSFTRDPDVLSK